MTPSEKKFRAKRKQQLKEWQAEHPGTRRSAAQHLHAPGTKPKSKTTSKKKSSGPKKPTATKKTSRAKR